MAITYTTLATENLGNNQTRVWRARNVAGGAILNVQVSLSISWPYNPTISTHVVDEEIFLPGATVSSLSSIAFTTDDTQTLDKGQKRIIRSYQAPTGGKVTEIIRTQDYTEAKGAPTKTQVVREELLFTGSGAGGVAAWFEWNGLNLTQFDSPIYGPNVIVGSSAVDVQSYAGVNWIRMRVAADASANTGNKGGIILPISATPPSADYVVIADFIAKLFPTALDVIGAGVIARSTSLETGYLTRYSYGTPSGANNQYLSRLNSGYTMTNFLGLDDPSLVNVDDGMTIGVAVEGQHIRALLGEKGTKIDSAHTAAGKAGLFQTNNGQNAITTECYYRNIRCYPISFLNLMIP